MAVLRYQLSSLVLFIVAGFLPGMPIASAQAGQGESLSALAAQGAARRFDTEIGFIDAADADQFSVQLQYTSVLRKKHQLTAALPLVDPDLAGLPALRSGDLKLGYSYSFKQTISANPWIPSNIGTGIGLSLPTGSFSDGSGSGSYVVSPRLGYVATIGHFSCLVALSAVPAVFRRGGWCH